MTKNIKMLIRRAAGVFCLGGMMLSAGLFTSCTEKDNTVEEFTNWQSKNETYWNKLYTTTQQKIISNAQTILFLMDKNKVLCYIN